VATHSRYYPRDKTRLDEGVLPWVSMAEALGWEDEDGFLRSNYGTGGDASKRGERLLSEPAATLTSKADRMKWILHTNRDQRPDGSRQTVEGDRPAPTFTAKSGGQWVFTRPATTVNCDPRISAPGRHDPNESGSQQKGAIRVTVEQAATLQSFPADYPWQGTKTKQFEQVGNAVPPGMARPVIEAALAAGALEAAA
jgi:DNA (cytosine-5)-methyltransferase 1